ncbi:MAG: EamA family transporter [Clostridia bacterium]|nr:EamA family transporter [Clostridia bacterium]
MNFNLYIPIGIIVFSNVFYHICSKSMPEKLNTFVALPITYLVGAVVSFILYFVLYRDGNYFEELKNINWTTWVLGIAIVGLEAGNVYMYKAGWDISTGQLICSSALSICLILVGIILYKEHLNPSKIAGIIICMIGLYFINK